ncbi:MAG: type II toxin-antitoxin system VapC family toxin [Sphingopyxis sp.]
MSDPFFDTNILIDWLSNSPKAIAELSRYKKHRISRIVWTELLAGVPIEERDILQRTISSFDVVEIDARIAAAAADIRYRSPMKLMDAYILATAQVNGAILVTRNTKDFPDTMPGIRVPYTFDQKAK